jgi:hypothetical protein
MARLIRVLNGGILGALFGLAVGAGIGGIISVVCLISEDPMDRGPTAGAVFVLSIGSCTLLGGVAGLASHVSKNGVSLLHSMILVTITAIAATALSVSMSDENDAMLLVGAFVGIVIGGVLVVLAGLGKGRPPSIAKQGDDTLFTPG